MMQLKRYSKVMAFFLATFSFVGMQAGEELSFVTRFEKIVKDLKRSHGDANREDLKKAYSYQPETACEEDCRQLMQDLHEDGKNLDWLVQAWLDAKLERVWGAFANSDLEPKVKQDITKDKFFWLFSDDSFNHSIPGSHRPTISRSVLDVLACFSVEHFYSETKKNYLEQLDSLHFGLPTHISLDSFACDSAAVFKDNKFEIRASGFFGVVVLHEAIHSSKLHTLKEKRLLQIILENIIIERTESLPAIIKLYHNIKRDKWFLKLSRYCEYEADILAYTLVNIDKLYKEYEVYNDAQLDRKLKRTHPRSISRISLSIVMYKLRNAEQAYLSEK